MGSQRTNIEKKIILAMNVTLEAMEELRVATGAGAIPKLADAIAKVEELKQLYIGERAKRKTQHESMGNFGVEEGN